MSFTRIQPALAFASAHLDEDVPLAALSERSGLSAWHFHRAFSAVAGETPKQFTLRLRLNRGAALLLGSRRSVLDIALSCGFGSHESFTRAFRRQFGTTPHAYRQRGFSGEVSRTDAAAHTALVTRVGPCVRLFHLTTNQPSQRIVMPYSIEKQDLQVQRVIVAPRRVKRSEIAATITSALGDIFQYAQQHGLALSGHPFTRYRDFGAGLVTIEPGMRIAGSAAGATAAPPATGLGSVFEDTLQAGPAMTTVHMGPYDALNDAYAALESWMESHGVQKGGPPWESYITDPAEFPDPKDWKTEIAWPVK